MIRSVMKNYLVKINKFLIKDDLKEYTMIFDYIFGRSCTLYMITKFHGQLKNFAIMIMKK